MKPDLMVEASPFEYFGGQHMDSKERKWSISYLYNDEDFEWKKK